MDDHVLVFEITANLDETGELEEFSWDLIPLVDPINTLHLDNNGLAKVGTMLQPGMILVGKIGKSKAYPASRKPTDLEFNALSFEELNRKFGHLWIDSSLRIPLDCYGEVIESTILVRENSRPTAIVRLKFAS